MNEAQMLETWLQKAAADPQFKLRTEGWERTVAWSVEGEVSRFRFSSAGVALLPPGPADLEIELDRAALEELTEGNLHFFLALWSQGRLKIRGAWGDAFRLGYLLSKDQRSGRVAFVAHCWLNLNTRFPGGGSHPGTVPEVVQALVDAGVGIVQMPCPEFRCFGLEKSRLGLEEPDRVRACFRKTAAEVFEEILAYQSLGYEVVALIGMDPSPSCGVNGAKGRLILLGEGDDPAEQPERGLFFEELQRLADEAGRPLPPLFGLRRVLSSSAPAGLAELSAALTPPGRSAAVSHRI